MKIVVVRGNNICDCMVCPNCGAHEVEDCGNFRKNLEKDFTKIRWNIEPFKVDNYSHCLQCDTWFK